MENEKDKNGKDGGLVQMTNLQKQMAAIKPREDDGQKLVTLKNLESQKPPVQFKQDGGTGDDKEKLVELKNLRKQKAMEFLTSDVARAKADK